MKEVYIKVKDLSWVNERFTNRDIVTLEEIISDYQDVLGMLDGFEEELEDLKQDIEDNYRPITNKEMYDI